MNFVWSAVLALGIGGAAFADDDDEAKTPARTYTQAEVEALQDLANRVLKLEELQQDAELEKLKAAAARQKQDEQKNLPERVSKLEKQMGSAGQTYDASKMLTFSTPDGNFTAKIGGRIYFVYRHIFDRADRGNGTGAGQNSGAPDSFIIDTARFQLDGTFFRDFFYRVEGEAKSGETVNGVLSTGFFRTKDVYIGWQGLGDWLTIQAGQFKCPLSQEETCSSRFIDFAERSILNRLVPGHVQGVMAKGALFDKVIEWNFGYMNGAVNRDSDRGSLDTTDEKDVFGRIFITPMKHTDVAFLRQMRFGFDFSAGERDRATTVGDVSTGDLGLPVVLNYTVAAGNFIEGIQSRWLGNFSWVYGPASIRAEYLRVNAQLNGAATSSQFHQVAWYISASFILTGEEKPLENRIKPKANFSPLDGNWGAFELAARWAVVDGRNGFHAGLGTAGTENLKTTEYTIGINWWWSPNVAVRIDWERLIYDEDQPLGNHGALKRYADEIYIRWQIDF
jgi:phosphate-selective porin OprO and OprP